MPAVCGSGTHKDSPACALSASSSMADTASSTTMRFSETERHRGREAITATEGPRAPGSSFAGTMTPSSGEVGVKVAAKDERGWPRCFAARAEIRLT